MNVRVAAATPNGSGHVICTAATSAGIDPDRVKFKRAVRIIRRRVAPRRQARPA
jgi:hypothetical protein